MCVSCVENMYIFFMIERLTYRSRFRFTSSTTVLLVHTQQFHCIGRYCYYGNVCLYGVCVGCIYVDNVQRVFLGIEIFLKRILFFFLADGGMEDHAVGDSIESRIESKFTLLYSLTLVYF